VRASVKLDSIKATKPQPTLAKITAMSGRQADAGIDPKLKAFIDRVVVPALVQEYLTKLRHENQLAANPSGVRKCSTNSTATAEGIR
jgi:hypothetical protein